MKSGAGVTGRPLTSAYRFSPSVYGLGYRYSLSRKLKSWIRLRCSV